MASRPTAAQAAGRLLALRCVVTYAMATPARDQIEDWLSQWSQADRDRFVYSCDSRARTFWHTVSISPIFEHLSPWERRFSETTVLSMSSQQHIDALWRMEAAHVLGWALHLVPHLSVPESQADGEFLKLEKLARPGEFLKDAVLRLAAEIDRAREIAELWHWRSRTEELIRDQRPFPEDKDFLEQGITSYPDIVRVAASAAHERRYVDSVIAGDFAVKGKRYAELSFEDWCQVRSISVERHRALNWLCGYGPDNDWDSTPTDT